MRNRRKGESKKRERVRKESRGNEDGWQTKLTKGGEGEGREEK